MALGWSLNVARRSIERRGGGRVQGFLEEDTLLIIGNCYIQAFFLLCYITVVLSLSMDSHVLG